MFKHIRSGLLSKSIHSFRLSGLCSTLRTGASEICFGGGRSRQTYWNAPCSLGTPAALHADADQWFLSGIPLLCALVYIIYYIIRILLSERGQLHV